MTRSGGRAQVAAAIRQARRRHCGVLVVKERNGSVHARPDISVCEGFLQITVASD